MTEAKGDGGEGLYVRGRSCQRDMDQGTDNAWSKSHGRSSKLRCYICQSREHLKKDCPRYNHKKSKGFVRNKDQVSSSGADGYDSAYVMMAMSVEQLECRIRGTCKVQVHMRDGSSFVLDNVSGVAKHLGIARIKQQNGLVEETNVTLLAKEDHAFEVEPQGNADHIAGSQEVQTHDLIDYHSPRDREQHSARELFRYKEDNNEAAFIVATVEKIYAYESLTFNDTVACEVISKWNAGLKEDMVARLHVWYGFSCEFKDEIWITKGLLDKAKGNVLGMKIIKDQSGNTMRVSQSRVYNGNSVQTLLDRHFILSLKSSLSRDCDVEKNVRGVKWSPFIRGRGMEVGSIGGLNVSRHNIICRCGGIYDVEMEAWRKERWLKELLTESRYGLRLVEGIAIDALVKGSFRSAVLSITIG
ncbi:zinc finger, CCHC-type containing protein [Tanacetum coccineum]